MRSGGERIEYWTGAKSKNHEATGKVNNFKSVMKSQKWLLLFFSHNFSSSIHNPDVTG